MKFGVLVFPGSNCDHDTYNVIETIAHQPVTFLWHDSADLQGVDAVLVPGGFAYGDYLRTGAIARFSPIMPAIVDFAQRGGPVLGICNGFQVLLEAGLLPGAMLRNADVRFHCEQVFVRVEHTDTPFTAAAAAGQSLQIPIAHGEGNYYASPDVIAGLESSRRVIFRYCDARGGVTAAANPNGAMNNIAGICNEARNVVGLMPHPERACEPTLGSPDGLVLLKSVVAWLAREGAVPAYAAGRTT